MSNIKEKCFPKVSVIIPCFNHGTYLPNAIESVLKQNYPFFEIVVVDDGSSDNTAEVANSFPEVKYVYQVNQGLSAARNTGVVHSSGEFLVFLDADDWLYHHALETNVHYLINNTEAAFVSGAYDNVLVEMNSTMEISNQVTTNHYLNLLKKNYVGMVATVMFRRWVFDEFLFDRSLKACEDYDLYLKITRLYPVIHHTSNIAAYRIYSSNMSSNLPVMLKSVLQVLKRQVPHLQTVTEKNAYQEGKNMWRNYYSGLIFQKLKSKHSKSITNHILTLLRFNPSLGIKYVLQKCLKL